MGVGGQCHDPAALSLGKSRYSLYLPDASDNTKNLCSEYCEANYVGFVKEASLYHTVLMGHLTYMVSG